jgi:hypothetical protein
MQRPRTRGTTAAGETKRWATQQSSRRQTVMMVRHITAGRCADALIPTLGLDASTLAAPFKCSLLDALDTSPTSSSTTSSSNTSPSDVSFCLLRRHQIHELGGETPWAPPGSRNKTKVPALWKPRTGGPLRIAAPLQDAAIHAAPGTSIALTLRGPAQGGALNAPSPVAPAMEAPRPTGSIDRVLREVEAALGPLPLVADASGPQEVAPSATGVVTTPRRLVAEMLGPLIAPGS